MPGSGRARPRCACGEPVKVVRRKDGRWYFWKTCVRCWKRLRQKAPRKASEVCLDWAKDPCARCGKYPLSIHNKRGYCRKCSHKVLGGHYYERIKIDLSRGIGSGSVPQSTVVRPRAA